MPLSCARRCRRPPRKHGAPWFTGWLLAFLLSCSAQVLVRPWAALRSAAWAHRAWQATGARPLPPYASHQRGTVYARAPRGLGQRAPGVRALAVGGEMAGRRRGTRRRPAGETADGRARADGEARGESAGRERGMQGEGSRA